jgi:transcriptional regulator with XRE-family HTH domain
MSRKISYSDIGNRLKYLRDQKNLTQQEFADSLGITQSWLSELETGIKAPSDVLIVALEYRYMINRIWLLTGNGEMYQEKKGIDEIEVYSAEEKDTCKKLLRIIRTKQETTVMAIKQNIEAFLTTPDKEKTAESPKKKIITA